MAKTGKVNKLEEREAKRRSAVAGLIDEPGRKPVPSGRPDGRELKKRYCLALKPLQGYTAAGLCAVQEHQPDD